MHPRAKPRTDTAPMLSLACVTFILSCALESVVSVELSISRDRVADRRSRAIVNGVFTPARVAPGRGTSVAPPWVALDLPYTRRHRRRHVQQVCQRASPAAPHFPCTSANAGSVFVSPHETVGHYCPGASGRLSRPPRAAAPGVRRADGLAAARDERGIVGAPVTTRSRGGRRRRPPGASVDACPRIT